MIVKGGHESRITLMSVKLTIIFFILICFEIGILLVILPWVPSPSWNENYLLVLAADKMHWPWLALAMKSGYARGAVSGLGVLNIMLGVWEIVNFKRTSRAFQAEWELEETNSKMLAANRLSDNRPQTGPAPDDDAGVNRPD